MILSKAFTSSRTNEFYTKFFKPRYEAWQDSVRHTPLVVMIWGPRQRTQIWTEQRRQIQESLRRLGHTVFFSEQLGVPIQALTQKGVEFLQSETADIIVVLQSTYGVVGAVQHFAESRVIDAKMLLFIDAAASDERLYHRALENLRAAYGNIETYEYPADLVHGNLLIKITEKIKLFQLVKYVALQNAIAWRVGTGMAFHSEHLKSGVHPLPANLLELYRAHRDEITILADSALLFILAYANYLGPCTIKALAHQVGLDEPTLQTTLMPLLRGQFMVHLDDALHVTGFGRHLLESTGFAGWTIPTFETTDQPLARSQPQGAVWRTVGLAFAAVLLIFFVALWYWSSTTQTQLPLEYTPTHPLVTQTLTRIVTPTVTPLPVR
ncbi:MAG: hypothetical protein N2559_02600 [Anaerolineae bacterium]|nr:hypothetical protein [Anaerolineae bacterium]